MPEITFQVKCFTKMGENVHLVGSTKTLGMWTPSLAVRMQTDKATYPFWKSNSMALLEPDMEFKYIVITDKGHPRWENMKENRTLPVTLRSQNMPNVIIELEHCFDDAIFQKVNMSSAIAEEPNDEEWNRKGTISCFSDGITGFDEVLSADVANNSPKDPTPGRAFGCVRMRSAAQEPQGPSVQEVMKERQPSTSCFDDILSGLQSQKQLAAGSAEHELATRKLEEEKSNLQQQLSDTCVKLEKLAKAYEDLSAEVWCRKGTLSCFDDILPEDLLDDVLENAPKKSGTDVVFATPDVTSSESGLDRKSTFSCFDDILLDSPGTTGSEMIRAAPKMTTCTTEVVLPGHDDVLSDDGDAKEKHPPSSDSGTEIDFPGPETTASECSDCLSDDARCNSASDSNFPCDSNNEAASQGTETTGDIVSSNSEPNVPRTRGASVVPPVPVEPAPSNMQLSLRASATMKPKDSSKEGEDACFVHDAAPVLGIADGVGDLARYLGNSSKVFATMLMLHCEGEVTDVVASCDPLGPPSATAVEIFNKGYSKVTCHGATTALVTYLDSKQRRLGIASLGDSGLMVLRRGVVSLVDGSVCPNLSIIFKTPTQQHSFNLPFQLCRVPAYMAAKLKQDPDQPSDSALFDVEVQEGDLVVLYTDGLSDNLHDEEIEQHVNGLPKEALGDPKQISEVLVSAAYERSHEDDAWTPFAKEASFAGWRPAEALGGKQDDITCIAAWVTMSA